MNTAITKSHTPVGVALDQTPKFKKRAFAYLRVSSEGQVNTGYGRNGLSIDGQHDQARDKSHSLEADLTRVFIDAGRSAYVDLHKRTDFLRMLEELKIANSNPATFVHYVIFWISSRWSRDVRVHFECHDMVKATGARLVSITEPMIGEDTPEAFWMEGMAAVNNQYESMKTGRAVKGGQHRKAMEGGSYGSRRLGYIKSIELLPDGRQVSSPAPDPERQHFITLGFQLYDSGTYSISQLAAELHRLGLRTLPTRFRIIHEDGTQSWGVKPEGKVGTTALQRILRNPYYAGRLVYKRGTPDEEDRPGRHDPLIDQETFDRVQLRLSEQRVAGERPQKRQHYLRGSAFCEHCHKRLIYAISTSKVGVKYPYFFCAGRINQTHCKQRINIKPELLEAAVEHYYVSQPIPLNPARIAKSKDAIRALATVSQDALHQVQEAKADLIVKLELQQDKLLDMRFEEKSIPASVFKRRQAKLETEIHEAKRSLAETEQKLNFQEAELVKALELAEDIASVYLAADEQTRRSYNQAFFKHIWVTAYWDDGQHDPIVEVTGVELNEPFATLLAEDFLGRLEADLRNMRITRQKARKRPSGALSDPDFSIFFKLAERAGFEPAMEFNPHTRLAGECLQPLGHLSLRPASLETNDLLFGSERRYLLSKWPKSLTARQLAGGPLLLESANLLAFLISVEGWQSG
jgi:site-specific DNA recombinase